MLVIIVLRHGRLDGWGEGKMEEISKKEWFTIKTQPLKETLAQLQYQRQGYEVWFPRIRRTVRHARRIKKVLKSLFPGYIFLHLGPDERNWTSIAGTIGATGPVRFGDYYPPVPEWLIKELKGREAEEGFITMPHEESLGIKPGDRITVSGDNDTEIMGIFQSLKGADRALILLDILKREVPAEVPLASIKAA